MKYIYLCGAMEAISNEEAKEWRSDCKESFKYFPDFRCIDPTDYYDYSINYHTNDFEIFRFDIKKVGESSVVLVNLDKIRKSVGSCDEIMYAYLHDIPVIGFLETEEQLTEDEIKTMIHPWKYIQINRIETGKNAMQHAVDYITTYL